jgi:hypothetical protein
MPFKFEHIITNYKGEDSFTHDYYQIEHTTIGMITAKKMAMVEYYKLYPNADEEKYLKVIMRSKYVDKEDIPEDKI